ncbi:MAG: MFS transporter [Spirochaetales bacterium]|nr:MFS transporter [Spirochaetales bacterium]
MYKSTIRACHLGSFIGASAVNLAPLLFVIFMTSFGLNFEEVGRLVLLNFGIQIVTSLLFSAPVDRWGQKPFILFAHLMVFAGLIILALAPVLFTSIPYLGLVCATIFYSVGAGLFELQLSAIIQSIPTDDKEGAMNLLHSFYAWGLIFVVVLTTTLLSVFGKDSWPFIVLFWSIFPLFNFFNFLRVPFPPVIEARQRTKTASLFTSRYFLLVLAGIFFAGATELSISQWTSAFAESSLGLRKEVGDLLGVTLFALFLGGARTLYGAFGKKFDLLKTMTLGSLLCGAMYLLAAFSPSSLLSLVACVLCGLGSALLWPGSVVNGANHFPKAGSSLFASLAAGGAAGAAFGPWLVGFIANVKPDLVKIAPWLDFLTTEEAALRSGLFIGTIFPVIMVILLVLMRRENGS